MVSNGFSGVSFILKCLHASHMKCSVQMIKYHFYVPVNDTFSGIKNMKFLK